MTEPATEDVVQEDAPEAGRPLRPCDVCGLVDDHPRHVFAHDPDNGVPTDDTVASQALANARDISPEAEAAVLKHVRDDSTTYRHMDCCRSVGCPDGTCYQVTAGATDLRGHDLVEHLTSREG